MSDELPEEEIKWVHWLGLDRRTTMDITHLPTGIVVRDEHHDWPFLKRRAWLLETLKERLRQSQVERGDTDV